MLDKPFDPPDSNEFLNLYVVYDHPKDHPDHVVVRRWVGGNATPDFRIAADVMAARQLLPGGLFRIGRDPSDDPVILETWV